MEGRSPASGGALAWGAWGRPAILRDRPGLRARPDNMRLLPVQWLSFYINPIKKRCSVLH
jgi:hypothetical protein